MSISVIGMWNKEKIIDHHYIDQITGSVANDAELSYRHTCSTFLMHIKHSSWVACPALEDEDTGVMIVVIGEIFAESKKQSLRSILAEYLSAGIDSLIGLNGVYIIVLWDPRTNTLHITNDRFAFERLYLWQTADGIVFSTDMLAITKHPDFLKHIDKLSIVQYLTLGYMLDNRTILKRIELLAPAMLLQLKPNSICKKAYWKASMGPDNSLSRQDAEELVYDAIHRAVSRRCDTGVLVLPITGGLDSRTLAGFLTASKVQPQCCSYGHAHCYDVRFGRKIANATGATHKYLYLPKRFFCNYLQDGINLCDGEITIEALPVNRLNNAGFHGVQLFTGFLGDVLSGGGLLNYETIESYDDRFDLLWRKNFQRMMFSNLQLRELLDLSFTNDEINSVQDCLRFELNNIDAPTFTEKSLITEIYTRQRRFTSYLLKLLRKKYIIKSPFTDIDVIDAWLKIPLEYKLGQKLYYTMISKRFPKLACIGETKTGTSILRGTRGRNSKTNSYYYDKIVKNLNNSIPEWLAWRLNHLKRSTEDSLTNITGGWVGPHDRKAYAHHEDSIRKVDKKWFQSKLNQTQLMHGWFSKSNVDKLFEEHLLRKANHSARINAVIVVLEWRRWLGV